jgi:hypothetical protein
MNFELPMNLLIFAKRLGTYQSWPFIFALNSPLSKYRFPAVNDSGESLKHRKYLFELKVITDEKCLTELKICYKSLLGGGGGDGEIESNQLCCAAASEIARIDKNLH